MDTALAKINVLIVVLLCVIYILRRIIKRNHDKTNSAINKLYNFLRQYHKFLGGLVIALGLIHGILSSENIFSLNLGTITWLVSLLLAANWYFKAKLKKGWMYYHRVLAAVFIVTLLFHMEEFNDYSPKPPAKSPGINNQLTEIPQSNEQQNKTITNTKYKDGIYTGNAAGYRPGLTVQVTVTNGVIAKILVVSHNERGADHYGKAIKEVPQQIIQKQSTAVEGVSGATRTSKGIKDAVNNALEKALP